MTAAEMSLALFTMVNSARVLAYLPQIVLIARDRSGARAISYSTWAMFSASHLSTVLYAVFAVSDRAMAAIFLVNMTFCLGIIALTAYKRRENRPDQGSDTQQYAAPTVIPAKFDWACAWPTAQHKEASIHQPALM